MMRELTDHEISFVSGGEGGGGRGDGGNQSCGSSLGRNIVSEEDRQSQAYKDAEARAPKWGSDGNTAGQRGTSRVICTHFYRKGMMERELWRGDLEYTFQHFSERTIRGYQAWAIPYVRLMRRSPLAEKIMYPLAYYRAKELAFKLGKAPKGSLRGKMVRAIGEPICFAIGLFAGEQNWQALWTDDKQMISK